MKQPATYLYPAVFTFEGGQISITFPDLPGCVSCADTEAEAVANAREALGGHLWCIEQDGDALPAPTPANSVELEKEEIVCPIDVYMPAVRLAQENKAVNRTVTLPAWLNAAALEKGVNFSQALQASLIEQLGLQQRMRV
ncbi:MAG: type II toxin-antitoxin system HicB family antitoxin [Clostridia bacterium]|nr:type II toxin-antitoxin system HicB family antitoxin [Clostridia bacterium]